MAPCWDRARKRVDLWPNWGVSGRAGLTGRKLSLGSSLLGRSPGWGQRTRSHARWSWGSGMTLKDVVPKARHQRKAVPGTNGMQWSPTISLETTFMGVGNSVALPVCLGMGLLVYPAYEQRWKPRQCEQNVWGCYVSQAGPRIEAEYRSPECNQDVPEEHGLFLGVVFLRGAFDTRKVLRDPLCGSYMAGEKAQRDASRLIHERNWWQRKDLKPSSKSYDAKDRQHTNAPRSGCLC